MAESEEKKRKERLKKFGLPDPEDEEDKKKQRALKFGLPVQVIDHLIYLIIEIAYCCWRRSQERGEKEKVWHSPWESESGSGWWEN